MPVGKGTQIDSSVLLYGSGGVVVGSDASIEGDSTIKLIGANSCLTIGDGARIKRGARIDCQNGASITIGTGTRIEPNTSLYCAPGASIEIAENCTIETGVAIRSHSRVKIGPASSIGAFTSISAREPDAEGEFNCGVDCRIGESSIMDTSANIILDAHVHMGPLNYFYTHNHVFEGTDPIWDQGIKRQPIHVERGVWIGAQVIVLCGTRIGEGAVLAAGSVVCRSVEGNEVVGGVPAKRIKVRRDR